MTSRALAPGRRDVAVVADSRSGLRLVRTRGFRGGSLGQGRRRRRPGGVPARRDRTRMATTTGAMRGRPGPGSPRRMDHRRRTRPSSVLPTGRLRTHGRRRRVAQAHLAAARSDHDAVLRALEPVLLITPRRRRRRTRILALARPLRGRVGRRGFLVLATQNPIEYEGTYPLPEAQLDRFSSSDVRRIPVPGRRAAAARQPGRAWPPTTSSFVPVIDREALRAMQAACEGVFVSRPSGSTWWTSQSPRVPPSRCRSGRRRAARSRC